jgi:predicted nucleic acid-binding protein
MKYLLDTNIYIEACRSEEKRARFRMTYFSLLPATFLSNDILIALCARRIGATLFTYNRDDFRLIHRHKEFSLRILELTE